MRQYTTAYLDAIRARYLAAGLSDPFERHDDVLVACLGGPLHYPYHPIPRERLYYALLPEHRIEKLPSEPDPGIYLVKLLSPTVPGRGTLTWHDGNFWSIKKLPGDVGSLAHIYKQKCDGHEYFSLVCTADSCDHALGKAIILLQTMRKGL